MIINYTVKWFNDYHRLCSAQYSYTPTVQDAKQWHKSAEKALFIIDLLNIKPYQIDVIKRVEDAFLRVVKTGENS